MGESMRRLGKFEREPTMNRPHAGAGKMFDLTGRIALITGGSRGLGLQIAEGLGEMGAKIVVAARKPAELDAAVAHLNARGIEAASLACDLSRLDAIPSLVDAALVPFGAIDMLVNNAGAAWSAPAEDTSTEAWLKVMNLNINAAFVLTREIGRRLMIPRRFGKILNIASIGGLGGNSPALGLNTIAYNASKAALINFTRALAVEWGRHDINVNALCPGWFPSQMSRDALARIEGRALAEIPLGRFGGPEDLKGAAVFLLSDAARHVTGQILAVDGGATA
jgi:gluconate 5-dehydrogenase